MKLGCVKSRKGEDFIYTAVFLQRLVGLNPKKFPAFYGNNFHYPVHNRPPMVPKLSQMNPVHTLSHSTSLRLQLLLSSYLRPGVQSRFFQSKTITIHLLSHTSNMCYTNHLHCFDYPNNISWGVQIMKLNIKESSQYSYCCFSLRDCLYTSIQPDLAKP
jgi:hypothetical protein